jgi:hypothetical protein
MTVSDVAMAATGRVATAAGITGLLGLVFLILLFTVGQPFGTLNDICIGAAAVLSAVLAWLLFREQRLTSSLPGQIAVLVAVAGAAVVVVGSYLVISRSTGFFLAGLYMTVGNGLIGLWLIFLNLSARQAGTWPSSFTTFGLATGVILALGLAAVPGIFGRVDSFESASWLINYVGWTGALGWLVLFPIWCLRLGRLLSRT